MTAPAPPEVRTFDDLTQWHMFSPISNWGLHDGWRQSAGAFSPVIGAADPYWGNVLNKARAAYGDPQMRFNTDDVLQDRYLVFGDGTPVPDNGALAYHDSTTKNTYLQNIDGSVSQLAADGTPGEPFHPAAYRRNPDGKLAPIDAEGHQLSPLVKDPPPNTTGYHDQNGVLTPKDAQGGYYTLGPDGKRHYFDKNGKPITPGDPTSTDPTGQALNTDEQQTGAAAAAIKELQDELRQQYSQIGAAEDQLSEVLLNAHATTVEGQRQLNSIQHSIDAAVKNPAMSIDTPAGQQAYLKFLRDQVGLINDVVASGTLSAEDQAKISEALTKLYAADTPAGASDPNATPPAPPAPSPVPQPAPYAAEAPAATPTPDPAMADPGLGPAPQMPDTTLGDLLNSPAPALATPAAATDPNAQLLSSMLPGMLGSLGGLGGGGGDPLGLSGLGGALSPLAGLASSGLGQQQSPPPPPESPSSSQQSTPATDKASSTDSTTPQPSSAASTTPPGTKTGGDTSGQSSGSGTSTPSSGEKPLAAEAPQPADTAASGAPPAAPAATPAPTNTVSLPDGSTATAKTPAVAAAVTAYQSGTPIDAAYRANGMDVPPPGTPVTNPLDPSQISTGSLGMFKDHYVVAASPVKAFANGQIVPLSSISSSPDFLGWMDPSALSAGSTALTSSSSLQTPAATPPVPAVSGMK